MNAKSIFELLKNSYSEFSEDRASRLAAAISYYTIFSIGPLVLILVSVASLVFQQAAREEIIGRIEGLVGPDAALAIQTMLEASGRNRAGIIATAIGIVTLLLSAIGLVNQLREALNTIWDVMPKPDLGIRGMIMPRVMSFLMVLGLGILFLAASLASTALSAVVTYFGEILPGAGILWQGLDLLVSFAVITLLFAMIYKVLPDVEIGWRDVWLGAAVTSLLFVIGKFAIGLYLANVAVASAYGAAGSLVVLLLWVYYSAQVFFFGAEFTQVYANTHGSRVVPAKHAQWIPGSKWAQQELEKRESQRGAAERAAGTPETAPGREALPARQAGARGRLPSPAFILLLLSGVVTYIIDTIRGNRATRA